MKKLTAIVLTLCLLLTAFCAIAEEETAIPEINWADIEPTIVEAGWEGEFVTFDQVAVLLYVPTALTSAELTEEDLANGYIGYYTNEDATAAFSVMYIEMGITLEAYKEQLLALEGVTEVTDGIINGIPVVTYYMPETDTSAVSMVTDTGNVLEFAFAPASDEGFGSVASIMVASIQPEVVEEAAE